MRVSDSLNPFPLLLSGKVASPCRYIILFNFFFAFKGLIGNDFQLEKLTCKEKGNECICFHLFLFVTFGVCCHSYIIYYVFTSTFMLHIYKLYQLMRRIEKYVSLE